MIPELEAFFPRKVSRKFMKFHSHVNTFAPYYQLNHFTSSCICLHGLEIWILIGIKCLKTEMYSVHPKQGLLKQF